jgi:hypothetical protein
MKRSKARVLVQIYNAISNSGVTWAKVQHIGWTKLRAIARALTPENADHWIEFASDHPKTEIIEQVRQELASAGVSNASGSTGSKTRAFKLHVDQIGTIDAAVEKMKLQSDTKSDALALEYICTEYLAGQTLEQKLPYLSASGLEEVITNLFGQYKEGVVKNILKSALAKFDGTLELASD